MKSKETDRAGANPPLFLEGTNYIFHDLITIKTRDEYKRDVVEKLRKNLAIWMKNPQFNKTRNELLDIAIVARVHENRMKDQDVDNIAKVVLDALQESKGDSRFLFYNDNQVIRLLIYKQQSKNLPSYNTDGLTVSFRIHDPEKQMVLVTTDVM